MSSCVFGDYKWKVRLEDMGTENPEKNEQGVVWPNHLKEEARRLQQSNPDPKRFGNLSKNSWNIQRNDKDVPADEKAAVVKLYEQFTDHVSSKIQNLGNEYYKELLNHKCKDVDCSLQNDVEKYLVSLSRTMQTCDKDFEFTPVLGGSTAEGLKLGSCDEWDYVIVLNHLSTQLGTEHVLEKVARFYETLETVLDNEVNRAKETNFEMNHQTRLQLKGWCLHSSHMPSLIFYWYTNGSSQLIKVDISPAIYHQTPMQRDPFGEKASVETYPPEKDNTTTTYVNIGNDNGKLFAMNSCSSLDKTFMNKLSQTTKDAVALVKILSSWATLPYIGEISESMTVSSYVLKNALFQAIATKKLSKKQVTEERYRFNDVKHIARTIVNQLAYTHRYFYAISQFRENLCVGPHRLRMLKKLLLVKDAVINKDSVASGDPKTTYLSKDSSKVCSRSDYREHNKPFYDFTKPCKVSSKKQSVIDSTNAMLLESVCTNCSTYRLLDKLSLKVNGNVNIFNDNDNCRRFAMNSCSSLDKTVMNKLLLVRDAVINKDSPKELNSFTSTRYSECSLEFLSKKRYVIDSMEARPLKCMCTNYLSNRLLIRLYVKVNEHSIGLSVCMDNYCSLVFIWLHLFNMLNMLLYNFIELVYDYMASVYNIPSCRNIYPPCVISGQNSFTSTISSECSLEFLSKNPYVIDSMEARPLKCM